MSFIPGTGPLRYGVAAEPRWRTARQFDRRLFVDQGQTFEEERRYSLATTPAPSGGCNISIAPDPAAMPKRCSWRSRPEPRPRVQAIRRPGTLKYGTGISFDQELSRDVGVFSRLGWNDGKTEDLHSPPSIGWPKAACR
jgi:high affinity Mn2+ porin